MEEGRNGWGDHGAVLGSPGFFLRTLAAKGQGNPEWELTKALWEGRAQAPWSWGAESPLEDPAIYSLSPSGTVDFLSSVFLSSV